MSAEQRLLVLVGVEVAIFALVAPNFWTLANAAECVRLGAELGVLAVAMTAVIVTGGIDLSVGSLMALCAVVLGLVWRDWQVPIGVAALAAVALGVAGGALNALMVARLQAPALIVTLGTMSLFRGLAEGVTRGIDNYSGFPAGFLFLGQGFVWGIPAQAVVIASVALVIGLLLHRTAIGRTLYVLGWSPGNARFAGVPVERRLALPYVLAGLAAGLAAIVYVARLGQAKADAGTGAELLAITAVVLGGASIRGGRGTIGGTLLGLAALVVLQNGLRLAGLPTELGGVLTGVLLVAAIGLENVRGRHVARSAVATDSPEVFEMKSVHVAILSGAMLVAAGLIAASNWYLARSVREAVLTRHGGSASAPIDASRAPVAAVIGMMPKAKGDPYFVSCRAGAEEAAREIGATLIWDGPTELDPVRQNEVVEGWITRGVDVVAVSVENQTGISSVLRKARRRGIKVLTWDADALDDARDFFVNQATPQGIGETLADEAARLAGGEGEIAIVTASLSAANQNEWIKHIRARLAAAHPGIRLVAIQPSESDRDRAFAETQTILKVHPRVEVIVGISAPSVPGVAEAVKQSGRKDVRVTGLSLPGLCRPYIKDGVIQSIVLWNTRDLGYLTVRAASALASGDLKPGVTSIGAGRLGSVEIAGDEVLLGRPMIFTKENIDQVGF